LQKYKHETAVINRTVRSKCRPEWPWISDTSRRRPMASRIPITNQPYTHGWTRP